MLAEGFVDVGLRGRRQVAQENILHGRQANVRSPAFDERSQRRAQAEFPFVLDTAIFHGNAVKILPVPLGVPAKVQRKRRDLHRQGEHQRKGQIALENFAKFVDAPVVHDIFDARPFAVAAVAMIAEQLDDRLHCGDHLIRL